MSTKPPSASAPQLTDAGPQSARAPLQSETTGRSPWLFACQPLSAVPVAGHLPELCRTFPPPNADMLLTVRWNHCHSSSCSLGPRPILVLLDCAAVHNQRGLPHRSVAHPKVHTVSIDGQTDTMPQIDIAPIVVWRQEQRSMTTCTVRSNPRRLSISTMPLSCRLRSPQRHEAVPHELTQVARRRGRHCWLALPKGFRASLHRLPNSWRPPAILRHLSVSWHSEPRDPVAELCDAGMVDDVSVEGFLALRTIT